MPSILELPLMHIYCMVDTHFGLEKYPYLTSFLKGLFSSKKILGSTEFAYIQHPEVNIQGTTTPLLTPAATEVLWRKPSWHNPGIDINWGRFSDILSPTTTSDWILLLLLSHFSHVRLCATPQTVAHQALPSLGFSRQEHWSRLPFPSPMQESEKWKWSCSVVSDPQRPHGLQPSRLLHPWDFPGKSTGVGCQSPHTASCLQSSGTSTTEHSYVLLRVFFFFLLSFLKIFWMI